MPPDVEKHSITGWRQILSCFGQDEGQTTSNLLTGVVLAIGSIQLADKGLCISKHIFIWNVFQRTAWIRKWVNRDIRKLFLWAETPMSLFSLLLIRLSVWAPNKPLCSCPSHQHHRGHHFCHFMLQQFRIVQASFLGFWSAASTVFQNNSQQGRLSRSEHPSWCWVLCLQAVCT